MFDNDANETDVREDLIVPFLNALGYRRGSANDIRRETSLKYTREQLGRQKPTDPVLRGRPDYVLSVMGAGRWILEAKGPRESLTPEVVGQALSYAKHPEISASYAVITNGRTLEVYSANQTAESNPIMSVKVTDPKDLAFMVTGVLSPTAVRRHCTPQIVPSGTPLAEGLSSEEVISKGKLHYKEASYRFISGNPQVTQLLKPELDARFNVLNGYEAAISSGRVFRDEQSRIVANISVAMHKGELNEFAKLKGFNEANYICLQDLTQPPEIGPLRC